MSACVCLCVCAGGVPGSLPASQAELQGSCCGWRVQASPLPPLAYWSMLGERKGGGRRGGVVWRAGEQNPERKRGGGATEKDVEADSHGQERRRRDVDAEGEVEKVNPQMECERNEGNGGVFLWLGRDGEDWERGRFKT